MDPLTIAALTAGVASGGGSLFGMFENRKRARDLQRMEQTRAAQALKEVKQIGGAARTRIGEQFTQAGGKLQSQLASTGLAASSVAGAKQRLLTTDRERAMQDLDDRLAQLRLGVLSGVGGAPAQALSSISGTYPSLSESMSLMLQPLLMQREDERYNALLGILAQRGAGGAAATSQATMAGPYNQQLVY